MNRVCWFFPIVVILTGCDPVQAIRTDDAYYNMAPPTDSCIVHAIKLVPGVTGVGISEVLENRKICKDEMNRVFTYDTQQFSITFEYCQPERGKLYVEHSWMG